MKWRRGLTKNWKCLKKESMLYNMEKKKTLSIRKTGMEMKGWRTFRRTKTERLKLRQVISKLRPSRSKKETFWQNWIRKCLKKSNSVSWLKIRFGLWAKISDGWSRTIKTSWLSGIEETETKTISKFKIRCLATSPYTLKSKWSSIWTNISNIKSYWKVRNKSSPNTSWSSNKRKAKSWSVSR